MVMCSVKSNAYVQKTMLVDGGFLRLHAANARTTYMLARSLGPTDRGSAACRMPDMGSFRLRHSNFMANGGSIPTSV